METTTPHLANAAVPNAEKPARQIDGFAVRGGVWATAIPFPSPLAYSYSYSLRYPAGLVVVDLGWNGDTAWDAFCRGLARAGGSLDDVIGVVATHAHPDHYGLAGRIREHTGAWIGAHPAERSQIRVGESERRSRLTAIDGWLRGCGVPSTVLTGLHDEMTRLEAAIPSIEPDILLTDTAKVPGTSGRLIALHTPGHTPGSLCFHDSERDLLFTGDHVLPKVTPNIAKRPGSTADPLHDFMSSLHRLRQFTDATVLPGHEWTFDRLSERLDAIGAHHRTRLAEVEQAVRHGCGTVWEVAQAVTWARPFNTFTSRSLRSALGETYAHLQRLTADGRLTHRPGPPENWSR
ncbi:MBL fold metallo-hydrolase [Actinoplanes sichuanensis]|uniref:MBL fold metallo-hydrolase n=1 Tax=Actinoplanes sichuanensis TaxID=512349 RepID=A0ABW4ALD2_9ACTN|nr:MBL fold metallo-hydrolase [Actinoplanes sichuanensis]BEL03734.1 MBL fold metallo-hydrolase [Actinoplanes sichuanensis]